MRRRLDRKDTIRLAKAYILERREASLAKALRDPSCPDEALLGAMLQACGNFHVSVVSSDPVMEFFGGPTEATAVSQLTYQRTNKQLSGPSAALMETVYLLWGVIENELDTALYLPPDLRRERIKDICDGLGIEEEFLHLVLRNLAAR